VWMYKTPLQRHPQSVEAGKLKSSLCTARTNQTHAHNINSWLTY
jgi:hypothetical protein